MNVHIGYKLHRTPDIDHEIQHWIEKIRKRLQVFRPELVHLKGLVEQNTPREGFTVSLNLRLPSGQMAAQESATTALATIKAAFDDLIGQIVRHKQLLRGPHRWQRRRVRESMPVEEVMPSLAQNSPAPVAASSDDIRSFVNASFTRLGRFVEREIFMREASGDLEPGAITADEIVDEAAARALDEQSPKPDLLRIEPWLYRLALQSIDDLSARLAQNGSHVNLEAPRRRRSELASDEPHFQFHQPDETMTTGSSIADHRIPTPEEVAYTDEMITLVQFALEGAAREDREAFILHALEGFSTDEIAAITNHKPDQVQKSIGRAREKLRHAFPVENPFRRKPLQQSGAY